MYEVELKVEADHDVVRDKLETIEATPVTSVTQVDTYYNAPDRDFAQTDEALRIRQETPADGETATYLTYKGPLVESASKSRAEAETQVADQEAMGQILEGLGYDPAATVEKERERYAIQNCLVTLDRVAGLGEYVEVEYETGVETEAAIEEARGEATAVMERLDLDPTAQIQTSYLGLLLEASE